MPRTVSIVARLSLLLPLFAVPSVAADTLEPASYQPSLARLVSTVLESEHFVGRPLDDEMSARWLDGYLERLDYNRMFFLAGDIESFERWRHTLDDSARRGTPDLEAAFHIHEVYRKRVKERLDTLLATLAEQEFDFTGTDTFDLDRSDDPWPRTAAEADALWRARIEEQILQGILRGDTVDKQRTTLTKRYKRLETDLLATEAPDVLEAWLGALAHSYDPHSDYMKPATNDDFDISMSNSLEGIGATLRTEGEYTLVVSLVPGGPADLGGQLRPGDKIVAVAQGSAEPVDVLDLRIERVVSMIRGAKGTEVRLTVLPGDAVDPSATKVIAIVRDQVKLTANDAKAEVRQIPDATGQILKVGIIDVPSFYQDFDAKRRGDPAYKSTTRDVRALLADLKSQSVDGLILDLRKNGGGSLSEAVELTGLFIPQGPVVQIGDRAGRTESMNDPDPKIEWNGPLMVLTSPLSASASEILAGAIQDYGRGLVVGSASTHGKGTVQNVIDLDPALHRYVRYPADQSLAGALKVTTHKFYRVSGASTQLEGVKADIILPSPFDGLDFLESDLDYALSWDQVAPLEYRPWANLEATSAELEALSRARIATDPAFAELTEQIARRSSDNSVVSLNLDVRRAELESNNESPEPDEDADDDASRDDDGPDIVLDEAARIMRDWLLSSKTTAQAG